MSKDFRVQGFAGFNFFSPDPLTWRLYFTNDLDFEDAGDFSLAPINMQGRKLKFPTPGNQHIYVHDYFSRSILADLLGTRIVPSNPLECEVFDWRQKIILDHLAIRVSGLDALREHLEATRSPILGMPETTDTAKSLYIIGPMERVIELIEPRGETAPARDFTIQGFHHFGFFCSDPAAYAKFFVELLGFREMSMPEGDKATDNGVKWIQFPVGEGELHFVPTTLKKKLEPLRKTTHPDLELKIAPSCPADGGFHWEGALAVDHLAIRCNGSLEGLCESLRSHSVRVWDKYLHAKRLFIEGPEQRIIRIDGY